MSSLCASSVDNSLAGSGSHPYQEPVCPFPLGITRLKCTFHLNSLLLDWAVKHIFVGLSRCLGLFGGIFHKRRLVAAFLIRAAFEDAGFCFFDDQIGRMAFRTGSIDGPVPNGEFTFRVTIAAVKGFSTPAPTRDELSFFAFRAGDPCSLLLFK